MQADHHGHQPHGKQRVLLHSHMDGGGVGRGVLERRWRLRALSAVVTFCVWRCIEYRLIIMGTSYMASNVDVCAWSWRAM